MRRTHTLLSALLLATPAGALAQTVDLEEAPATEEPSDSASTDGTSAPDDKAVTETESETAVESGTEAEAESSAENESESDVETESGSDPEASAVPEKPGPNYDHIPEIRGKKKPSQRGAIGLSPGAPQAAAMAGGVTPAFGSLSSNSTDWVFDIHGFLQLPLRVGINERESAGEGQKTTVLHTPPVIPGTFGTFEYTGVTPDPWAQLNFSYGNRDVTATVIIAARTVSNANSYFNPSEQLGINDAFITFHPGGLEDSKFQVNVGAFANRYGIMGEYDMGRYGTPVIGRVAGMGATATGTFDLGNIDMTLEGGVMGPLSKAPVGVEPAGWNGFTDPNAGSTFAPHGHVSLGFGESVTVGGHAIYAFAQDDRATTTDQKDGSITVLGLDARLSMQKFGHLYAGYGFTSANTARSVSPVLRVLNAAGGLGLMEEYFGMESEGTGELSTGGLQYDFSLGNFLRAPERFDGKGPDLVLSGFALGTVVSSPDPDFDSTLKLKYGGVATYSFLKWMGAGIRYDRVLPDTDDSTQTHAIVSPRLIFKSDWASRDQVSLQYSRYFHGSNVAVVTGYPPQKDTTVVPDEDVFSLTASMWW